MRLTSGSPRPVPCASAVRCEWIDPSSLVERTNHRYGLAPRYRRDLTHAGLSVTAEDAEAQVAYVLEAPTAKLFLGFQGHPELQSTPAHPHPGFVALLRTAARLPG